MTKVKKTVAKKKATRRPASKKVKLKNHVVIVLDRSGSMGTMRKEAIDTFNSQVEKIKEKSKTQETFVSLVTFSTEADSPKFWDDHTDKLTPLTEKDYVPEGMTAMYDALGRSIDDLKKVSDVDDPNTSFLVITISDGQENNSKRYTSSQIAERIQACQKTGRWTFAYLGANQDLSQVSATLNIPVANTMSFQASGAGVRSASLRTTNALDTYYTARAGGQSAVMNFYQPDADKDDKDAQDKKPTK